ncbi:MAG: DUF302 domain-containing protein [Candidatus Peregrinibacteria bacterium]|nr:DUF302 domain-containing protein [Candidatus Peregrinibacteria bacterium]
MRETSYGFSREVDLEFSVAVESAKEALAANGFGVLTTIDVKAKMKEKLGEEMDEYIILGACHPQSAFRALNEETEIGLLLPCNVIVYRKDDSTFAAVISPTKAMHMIEKPGLAEVAKAVEERLKTMLESL